MDFKIKHSGNFEILMSEQQLDGKIQIVHLKAENKKKREKLNFEISWEIPDIGIHTVWTPGEYRNKEIVPEWGGYSSSCAMSLAPVLCDVSYDDKNKQTIACSDAKNKVEIHTGVVEEYAFLRCVVRISIDYEVEQYEADIRIDRRDIPFYDALADVCAWWETYEGYEPACIPTDAYEPAYSTWYSFHQQVDPEEIVNQCRYFSKLGCRTVIVDDGWQTENSERGYAYCGDWQVAKSKIPDMKAFVDAVHENGMKLMLWYSVPYIGAHSEAYARFRDKLLYRREEDDGEAYVVDPRYPEVRSYLIGLYMQAAREWGLDGFKLDFVDAFRQSDIMKEGMDYVSVFDAVERLLKDVIHQLREYKPDIMIEFRQSYIGPLMRTFGNMLRSMDCPCDSWSNGMNTLALRMLSGNTAVHSDMVMWNYHAAPEEAAFQLNQILFSVPQISVREELLSGSHKAMLERYLKLWKTYQDTLLFGKMLYKGYAYNFPYVSASNTNVQVGLVRSGAKAYIEQPTEEIVLVNASYDSELLIHIKNAGHYRCRIYDCCGEKKAEFILDLEDSRVLEGIPVNGSVILVKVENIEE